MPILRFIIFIVTAAVVITLIKNYIARRRQTGINLVEKTGNLVRCDYCGVHFSPSNGVKSQERYYCSEEHREKSDKLRHA